MKNEYLLGGLLQKSGNEFLYLFGRNGRFISLNDVGTYKLAKRWKSLAGVERFIAREVAGGSNWSYCVLIAPELPSAAAALGRMGAGVPRVLSDEERQARRDRLKILRAKRWPGK